MADTSSLIIDKAILQSQKGASAKALELVKPLLHQYPDDYFLNLFAMYCMRMVYPATSWPEKLDTLFSADMPPVLACARETDRLISLWLLGESKKMATLAEETEQALKTQGGLIIDATAPDRQKYISSALRIMNAFITMMKALAPYPLPATTNHRPLYMLGDSHVLGGHRQTVNWQGKPHTLHGNMAAGCKLWHLADPKPNGFKGCFDLRLKDIPADAPLLLSLGEIDSRPNEGIWTHARKTGQPAENVARETAAKGFAWLQKRLSNRSHVMVWGFPAPSPTILSQVEERASYAVFVAAFNEMMKEQAAACGWPFFNLYQFTSRLGGQLHADNFHLKPTAYPQAFTATQLMSRPRQSA